GKEMLDGLHETRVLSIKARLLSCTSPQRSAIKPRADYRTTPSLDANPRGREHVYRPGTACIALRSASSRWQPCSAIIRCPVVASLGILARQAFKESSIEPAATALSPAVTAAGAGAFVGMSAAWAENTNRLARRVMAPDKMRQWIGV